MIRWLRFGRWPSLHDLDLILDGSANTYAGFERLAEHLHPYECQTVEVAARDLPLPARTLGPAMTLAGGLPLDVFVSPHPGSFSVAGWTEPPYDVWHIGWRPTLDADFFLGAVPLDVIGGAT